ncbi:uncharacterized protein PADG_02679 [Paracoccidioides brasiliensis Pb18]|uniref:Uncharacterized protein n=1 Tax=Paracoccidioides brasiliensis (strain Pb18) TaxID=502780 RepID=C1G674_PARBD|nr:uncharacterized protein PADG_02679 [Paracoccidioides brasiliensis Pb18]EEH46581.2 hypothetical protein PADG_02679 [Paracoccidioides brasiliensis Pb18]
MRSINRILLNRPSRRVLQLPFLLCIFLSVAVIIGHNLKAHQNHQIKSLQEQYHEEAGQYPSVFKNFVSTLTRLTATPEHLNNAYVVDDPRFADVTGAKIPKIYSPYPDYQSQEWNKTHRGRYYPCEGPRGKLVAENLDDQVGAYVGDLKFPKPMFGSHGAIGLNENVFFDRYTRYGAYGFGENETDVKNWKKPSRVKWDKVNWGKLQRQCVAKNAARFYSDESLLDDLPRNSSRRQMKLETRTALLIRTYVGKTYSDNDMHVIRSMITELSLQSGGEYTVFLLLHVKDGKIELDKDDVYKQVIKDHVPREFWEITVLWNIPMVSKRYPDLVQMSLTDVHRAQWLSVQHFALTRPEFNYIWNWELDSRFTGHHYEFASKLSQFSRNQPRRGLWERNARFYIPALHGSYNHAFRNFTQQSETETIWGPMPINLKSLSPEGPSPPVPSPEEDNYEWSVGEDADYIGFLPIFHPIGTEWVIRNEVYGYLGSDTPRRASLITHSRLSRRLLLAMDSENVLGRHMSSELFPVSVSLLHGFKAVAAPHPIYSDRNLSSKSAERWFNPGINGRSGSSSNSPFGWKREARFLDLSWYYRANLAGRLYWNFLGWEKGSTGGALYEFLYGRVVLPSILFHPIKDVHPDANSMGYNFDFQN